MRWRHPDMLRRLLVVIALGWMSAAALAHQSGNSYLRIASDAQSLQVQLDFAVRDIDSLLQVPVELRKPLGRAELPALSERLAALVQVSLVLEADGMPVTLTYRSQDIVLHNDGLYVRQIHAAPALPPEAAQLRVHYGFFNADERVARAFVKLESGGLQSSAVFDARHASQRLALRELALPELLWTYAREGARHIWSGTDHLLFLLCLLLPGLSLWQDGTPRLLRHALAVITAFTVAHSVTLAAATLDWVVLPDRWVEAGIAASIVASAWLNLRRSATSLQWKLALGFGLIHGLGFASGLRELGLSSARFIETLLAFNLGVEAGQLLVVGTVGLLLWPLLRQPAALGRLQRWGSVGIGALATVWLAERLA